MYELQLHANTIENVIKFQLKGKFTLFFKCIYYRAYSMVGIIIHLMCVKSLQLACNYLLSVGTGDLAICRSMSSEHVDWNHYELLTHYQTNVLNP